MSISNPLTEEQWLAAIRPSYLIGYLEGRVGRKKLEQIWAAFHAGVGPAPPLAPADSPRLWQAVVQASRERQVAGTVGEGERQCRLLRCLLGNPFRPWSIDPAWLAWNNGAVRRIARTIAAEGCFDQLPVLADALEEAGCTDESLLRHCRGFEWCGRCRGTGQSEYDLGYYPPPREPCPECAAVGWRRVEIPHARGCRVLDGLQGRS